MTEDRDVGKDRITSEATMSTQTRQDIKTALAVLTITAFFVFMTTGSFVAPLRDGQEDKRIILQVVNIGASAWWLFVLLSSLITALREERAIKREIASHDKVDTFVSI